MSDSSNSPATEQQRRDAYMEAFSNTFADELVQLYELDGSADAVEHLKACIEVGADVWGQPLQIPNPLK